MEAIIILALVFGFVALRLFSVLGRRTGHEQPIAKPAEAPAGSALAPQSPPERTPRVAQAGGVAIDPEARDGLQAIRAAEPGFDPERFLDGAQSAYRMILEAYWKSDEAELGHLANEEVQRAFSSAIAGRREAGLTLDNRLVAIERAQIERARLESGVAHIKVRFDADIAAVTRDQDGNVVAGSLSDAVPTHDAWTFSRTLRSSDPNWLLTETDEAA